MSDNPIMSFQELETALRIIDAAPRNGTLEVSVGEVKLSVTRGDAQVTPAPPAPAETSVSVAESGTPGSASGPAPVDTAAISQGDTAPGPAHSTEAVATDIDGHVIEAPMTGVFYAQSEPGAAPFVEEGDHVEAGDVVGIIEVMKLMNRLTTPVAGKVRQVPAENAQLVEYGTTLFIIEPDVSTT